MPEPVPGRFEPVKSVFVELKSAFGEPRQENGPRTLGCTGNGALPALEKTNGRVNSERNYEFLTSQLEVLENDTDRFQGVPEGMLTRVDPATAGATAASRRRGG
jgi:hypothetical protein